MAKLKAVNDDLIYEFINSGKYDINNNGIIKNSKGKHIGYLKKTELKLRNKQYVYVKYKGYELKVRRIIFAKYSNEKLQKDLVIHHKNNDSIDNRYENLKMVTQQSNLYFRYAG